MDESLPSAGYDPLTGLATRNLLHDRLHQALRFAERDLLQVAVLVIDLNRFRAIVEGISRAAGDDVLKTVAARIVGCVRNTDTAARMEADEFGLMLAGAEEDPESAFHVAQRIGDAISQPMVVEGRTLSVTCAIGVALYPGEGQSAEVLLGNAAAAMRLAKRRGLNVCDFYGSEVNALAERRESAALRRALERHELVLHYQPKVDLRTGQVIQLEALVRWEKPEHGTLLPNKFIPLAEETGLIEPMCDWILRTACAQNKAWQERGFAPVRVTINLSSQQFNQSDVVRKVHNVLAETGLEARHLGVELTESMLIPDLASSMRNMYALHELGVQIALDDFGTGWSSLNGLKRLPIDMLQMDRSFVVGLDEADGEVMASAIIDMAHGLRLKVLAEGVETEEQLDWLRAHDCDMMQGFYFSKPLPAEEIAKLLSEGRGLAASDWIEC